MPNDDVRPTSPLPKSFLRPAVPERGTSLFKRRAAKNEVSRLWKPFAGSLAKRGVKEIDLKPIPGTPKIIVEKAPPSIRSTSPQPSASPQLPEVPKALKSPTPEVEPGLDSRICDWIDDVVHAQLIELSQRLLSEGTGLAQPAGSVEQNAELIPTPGADLAEEHSAEILSDAAVSPVEDEEPASVGFGEEATNSPEPSQVFVPLQLPAFLDRERRSKPILSMYFSNNASLARQTLKSAPIEALPFLLDVPEMSKSLAAEIVDKPQTATLPTDQPYWRHSGLSRESTSSSLWSDRDASSVYGSEGSDRRSGTPATETEQQADPSEIDRIQATFSRRFSGNEVTSAFPAFDLATVEQLPAPISVRPQYARIAARRGTASKAFSILSPVQLGVFDDAPPLPDMPTSPLDKALPPPPKVNAPPSIMTVLPSMNTSSLRPPSLDIKAQCRLSRPFDFGDFSTFAADWAGPESPTFSEVEDELMNRLSVIPNATLGLEQNGPADERHMEVPTVTVAMMEPEQTESEQSLSVDQLQPPLSVVTKVKPKVTFGPEVRDSPTLGRVRTGPRQRSYHGVGQPELIMPCV